MTINLNGIRSASRKGFFEWVKSTQTDIICVQELKAQECDLQHPLFCPEGYQHCKIRGICLPPWGCIVQNSP